MDEDRGALGHHAAVGQQQGGHVPQRVDAAQGFETRPGLPGGRQLDTVLSSCDALRAVVDAVHGEAEVFVDGGIRRGTDVLKALALGARAVLVGRPYLWGLAVDGERGVRRVLTLLREDLSLSMALAGAPRIDAIGGALLAR